MIEIKKSDYKAVSDFKRAKIQLYTAWFFLVFLSILKKASGQVASLGWPEL